MEIKNTVMQGLDEVWHILYADGKREKQISEGEILYG